MSRIPGLDDMESVFKALVRQLMIDKLGKDPTRCELCGVPCKATIHHTKYDGATLYDLVFACMRCQLQTENKGLA